MCNGPPVCARLRFSSLRCNVEGVCQRRRLWHFSSIELSISAARLRLRLRLWLWSPAGLRLRPAPPRPAPLQTPAAPRPRARPNGSWHSLTAAAPRQPQPRLLQLADDSRVSASSTPAGLDTPCVDFVDTGKLLTETQIYSVTSTLHQKVISEARKPSWLAHVNKNEKRASAFSPVRPVHLCCPPPAASDISLLGRTGS